MREVVISPLDENQRLNKFLKKYLNKAPESFIYKMLRKRNIKLNGGKAVGNEILSAGDVLSIFISEESLAGFMEAKKASKSAGKVDVVFEDENILVCNKPAGVLSQKENADDFDTMSDRVVLYLRNKGEYLETPDSAFTPALCNRLDRNTGGLVLCGKNFAAAKSLNELIKERRIRKFYVALVKGEIDKAGELRGYHSKDSGANKVNISERESDGAKEVFTKYRPLRVGGGYTLLEIELVTGKAHQIRAHLCLVGHPIAGDKKYGDERVNNIFRKNFGINCQLLYANRIVFENCGGFLKYLDGFECSVDYSGKFRRAIEGSLQ